MKNKNIIIAIVIIIFVVLVGYSAINQKKNTATLPMNADHLGVISTGMSEKDSSTGEVISMGTYENYSPEKLAKAEDGNVVLSFSASWCPSCRALEKDILANSANIPSDLTILKLNYDKEKELKSKYGVRVQHTLVQVDTDGNMIKKWIGSPTLSDIVSKLQ